MCCFSGPVRSVSSTRIFGRLSGTGSQYLAYQMKFDSEKKNAMILPLPTPPSGDEDAVRFIDLSEYDSFFKDLNRGFPKQRRLNSRAMPPSGAIDSPLKLEVHRVGNFDASFVPSMDDFDRLDPRFVISKEIWAKLPEYKDWGFAVFQLHQLSGQPHPMAFEFKTRLTDTIYFPTVHIHDGQVHATEDFDHDLYLQHASFDSVVGEPSWKPDPQTQMVRSTKTASEFVKIEKSKGLVDGDLLAHWKTMKGNLPNKDFLVTAHGETKKNKYGVLKTVLPLGVLAPVTWIIRRRQMMQRNQSKS